MSTAKVSILLVEDNPLDVRLIREILKVSRSLVSTIQVAENLSQGLAFLESAEFDATMLDLSLPDSDGLGTFVAMHKGAPNLPIIILTGTDDEALAIEAMQQGAQDYLVKGQLYRNHIERSLTYGIERHKILDELKRSRQSLRTTTAQLKSALRGINLELQTAKMVQKAFLPQDISSFPGVSVGAQYAPCGSVGGDLYDAIQVDENKTAFLLLDVAGHGVPAALIAAMARLSFARNTKKGLHPREIFERVNAELINYLPPEKFVSAILGIFDAETMRFSLARAGNPPGLLLGNSAVDVDQLSTSGTFIGVFPDGKFGQMEITLHKGDRIILYTDGLIECTDPEESQFGKSRLSRAVLETRLLSPEETVARLLGMTTSFVGDAPQRDDITLLVLDIL